MWSHRKSALDDVCGVKEWTLHDLRRTLVTGMNELGVEPHYVEAVVNHKSGHKAGVAGVYNHAKYFEPMKRALAAWAKRVRKIVHGIDEGDNVVTLHAA
jgi:hypothetical protein